MKEHFKLRIKALFYDYLFILVYLMILFSVAIVIYLGIFGKIPTFTENASQWLAFLTSVLPVTLIFTLTEASNAKASLGKRKVGLKIAYKNNPLVSSLIRNSLKFLPWQLAHFAVIKGLYSGFNSFTVIFLYIASLILPMTYIFMVMFRKDHRHLPDLLANTKVYIQK